jgi:Zn-dependent protease
MLRAFSIGRLFGIRLDVHTSWLPIFALVTFTLANAVAPATAGPLGRYAIAVAGALVLFASVLAHELAHALTARRFGVQTSSIALFLFGGVATLADEPPTRSSPSPARP